MNVNGGQRPRVVILGGGFGGLHAARKLQGSAAMVTLIDRRNHHLFQPLLYQVATAALNPSDIAAPIRRIVKSPNITVLLDQAEAVDLAGKKVRLLRDELAYDYLVIATGSTHSYFGHDDWEKHAPGLKSIEDAIEIRGRVLMAFEAAEREPDPERRKAWLTFVVIGGGATGVELAGALCDIARASLAKEYKSFQATDTRVVLVEGAARVLGAFPETLSDHARRSLERIGVEVRTKTIVTDVTAEGVRAGPDWINARTVLWGAGVAASPLAKTLGVPLDRVGRVLVTPSLTIPGHDEVFVIGDLASLEYRGKPLPGIAPAAMQAGTHAGVSILRQMRGQPLTPFAYWDRGMFAVIGRGAAIGIMFEKWKVSGLLAWLAWLGIHIAFLIGFRNRLVVLFNWAYSFFTLRINAQLITGEDLATLPPLERAAEPNVGPGKEYARAGENVDARP
ncbi:MAG TPA: NAD(P)/FAD-dependent oxidoreductase [Polyangiaceae bacterium]|nr:NAD(P)/FAD-dependent oxidoreductase [Polyangiaceae bacterium]